MCLETRYHFPVGLCTGSSQTLSTFTVDEKRERQLNWKGEGHPIYAI